MCGLSDAMPALTPRAGTAAHGAGVNSTPAAAGRDVQQPVPPHLVHRQAPSGRFVAVHSAGSLSLLDPFLKPNR
ncbi:hypothetical protein ADK90_38455 [Streptomyces sp. XY413]|nr:hypothetical protein ADK61_02155 [Streptomyces sp. XY66]KOV13241.1 hypothetical protein ADK90_38455 [Streptomyces sp. XY413]